MGYWHYMYVCMYGLDEYMHAYTHTHNHVSVCCVHSWRISRWFFNIQLPCVCLSFCWLILRTWTFSLLQNIVLIVIDKLSSSLSHNSSTNNNTSNNNNENTNSNNQDSCSTINRQVNKATVGQIVIPYTKGIAESIKQTCGKYGIQVYFKGNTTIKQVLMKPKDWDPKDSKSGLIYSYQCHHLHCDEEYIGETSRTLGERRKEHLKQPSPYMVIQKQQDTP